MSGLRYFVGALAFGFAAIWIMASLAGALVCLLAGVVGYGAILVAERTRAKLGRRAAEPDVAAAYRVAPPRQTPGVGDLPQWADVLNSDLGHVYEPAASMAPLVRDGEYGWPLGDDTVITRETLQ